MYDCFNELESEGKIKFIPYSEMSASQKYTYNDDLEPIYKIIEKKND